MKKINLLIALIVFTSISLNAQWTTQTSGTTDNLYDVFFTTNDIGFAVGDNGTILNTTNGGVNWTAQVSGITSYLHGVTFTNTSTGYAVGESGVILKTIDAGTTWNTLNSGTSTSLLDIFFIDANNGYAVGWNGVVLKTIDAGVTWTSSGNGINTSVNLLGVQFTSVNVGYITGLSGFLYQTIDGGANWNLQSLTIGSLNLFETHFISSNVGFVVGENSSFLKTIDGGVNWTSTFGGGIVLRGVYFANSNTGYAVGDFTGTGIIRETVDGGVNWSTVLSGGSTQNNVYFPSQYTGYAVGNNGEIRKLSLAVLGIDTRTECDSLVWIDGNTYTSNNNTATHNIIGGAINGNDSLVTLDLTILNSASGIDVQLVCNSYTWIDGNTFTSNNNTATYNITGGAVNGCDSIVTLDLTINTIDVSVIDNSPILTANSTGANYQWMDCNNNFTAISGENNQSFTATTNGNYAVEITENGCTDTSTCIAITAVSLNEINSQNHYNIIPNPASDFILFQTTKENSISNIKIYNSTGQIVEDIKPIENVIDISRLENGIYIVFIFLEKGLEKKKLIIRK